MHNFFPIVQMLYIYPGGRSHGEIFVYRHFQLYIILL